MFSLYGFSWSNEYSYDFNKRIVLSLTNFICLYIEMSQTHKTRYMELIWCEVSWPCSNIVDLTIPNPGMLI